MTHIFRSKMTSNVVVSIGNVYRSENSFIWVNDANGAQMMQCVFKGLGRDFDVLPENLGISHDLISKNLYSPLKFSIFRLLDFRHYQRSFLFEFLPSCSRATAAKD